ncbi:MAG: hypothetical protein Q7S60_02035 [bacterium]|nr:hypothetical protein [bacterium]
MTEGITSEFIGKTVGTETITQEADSSLAGSLTVDLGEGTSVVVPLIPSGFSYGSSRTEYRDFVHPSIVKESEWISEIKLHPPAGEPALPIRNLRLREEGVVNDLELIYRGLTPYIALASVKPAVFLLKNAPVMEQTGILPSKSTLSNKGVVIHVKPGELLFRINTRPSGFVVEDQKHFLDRVAQEVGLTDHITRTQQLLEDIENEQDKTDGVVLLESLGAGGLTPVPSVDKLASRAQGELNGEFPQKRPEESEGWYGARVKAWEDVKARYAKGVSRFRDGVIDLANKLAPNADMNFTKETDLVKFVRELPPEVRESLEEARAILMAERVLGSLFNRKLDHIPWLFFLQPSFVNDSDDRSDPATTEAAEAYYKENGGLPDFREGDHYQKMLVRMIQARLEFYNPPPDDQAQKFNNLVMDRVRQIFSGHSQDLR